ncbi:MAG: DUF2730 family protein [Pseudolabrys sp.]
MQVEGGALMLEYAPVAAVVLSALTLAFTVISNRTKVNSERFKTLAEKVDQKADAATMTLVVGKLDVAEDRIAKMEATVEHLPDAQSTHKLEIAVTDLRGQIATLSERIKPVAAMADRIQEAMIDQVKIR